MILLFYFFNTNKSQISSTSAGICHSRLIIFIFPDKDAGEFLRYYSRSPSQHLKGHWLEAAGFGTETVEHGQLLIRIVAE
ncbi:hypothetical protein BIY26_10370 [Brenneria goodwinii]|uniref:Toxin SymE-like domain-containing protein n=1 Tax=Brenneria goodwinii TaxID=1109412 RepID=A0AAE8ET66_9GAMM|nr:hypothetical protein BIY26_10370 [Brenneria goodwinii]